MTDTNIPIQIEVRPPSSSDVDAVVRSFADIKARVEAQGREVGQSLSKSMKPVSIDLNLEKFKFSVRELTEISGKSAKDSASAFKQMFMDMDRQAAISVASIKQQMDKLTTLPSGGKSAKDSASAFAAALGPSQQDIFKLAGIKSPQETITAIGNVKKAQSELIDMLKNGEITYKSYSVANDNLIKKLNLFSEGNVRARGELHQFIAKLASLSFEVTGAVYGLTSLVALFGSPALFGTSYLKSIEDARIGLTGTLIAMGKFSPGADKFSVAMGVANNAIKSLQEQSIKFGIPLDEIVNVMRAVTASGLGAGMTIEEVGKASTIASVAVKALGLDARQVVQETRDLFMGGIQPASSTLATSLGLKDSDIKKAKQDAAKGIKSFYDFMMEQLSGYQVIASERANTMSGALDILKIKFQRLFSDESLFSGIKDLINQISNSIGTLNTKTGELTLNKGFVAEVKNYLDVINSIVSAIGKFTSFLIEHGRTIQYVTGAWLLAKIAMASIEKEGVIGALISRLISAKAAYEATAIAAVTSAETQGVALSGFSSKIKSLGSSIVSFVGPTGLMGMAIFAAFEVADYFGVIDKVFGRLESRLSQFKSKLDNQSKADKYKELERTESNISTLQPIASENLGKLRLPFTYQAAKDTVTGEIISKSEYDKMDAVTKSGYEQIKSANDELDEQRKRRSYILKQLYAPQSEGADFAATAQRRQLLESTKEILKGTQFEKIDELKQKLSRADSVILDTKKSINELKLSMKGLSGKDLSDSKAQLIEDTKNLTQLESARKDITKQISDAQTRRNDPTLAEKRQQAEQNALEKIGQKQKNITYETDRYVQSIQDAIDLRELELQLAGKRSDEVALIKDQRKEQAELNLLVKKYQDLTVSIMNDDHISQAQKDKQFSEASTNHAKERAAIVAEHQANQDSIKKTFEIQNSATQGGKNAWNSYANGAITAAQQIENAFGRVFKGMEDALVEFVKTGKISFTGLVNSMIDDMIRMAAHSAVKNTMGAIGTAMGGSGGTEGFFGSIGSSIAGLFSAHGNAFDTSGHIQKFAKGGQFTNSLVSQPTMFAFANGGAFGMMGEAGPEAVMPLTRTPSGDLGVRTTGGSGVSVMVNVNIDSNGNSTTTTDGGQLRGMGDVLGALVANEIVKQQRPGGLLNNLRK